MFGSQSQYYRALESVSIASALSSALTIYPCQIRVHQTLTVQLSQLGRRSGGRPQQTVYPSRLPVNTVIHTALVGLEPTSNNLPIVGPTSYQLCHRLTASHRPTTPCPEKNGPPKHVKITLWIENVSHHFFTSWKAIYLQCFCEISRQLACPLLRYCFL